MSIRLMSEVWQIDLPASDKLVLLALADCANDEGGKLIAEDVKASNGFMSRDVPLRFALFRHLFPEWELRVTK